MEVMVGLVQGALRPILRRARHMLMVLVDSYSQTAMHASHALAQLADIDRACMAGRPVTRSAHRQDPLGE